MIPTISTLSPREHDAVARFLGSTLSADAPPLLGAFLFGSKARGDYDRHSDLDILMICDMHPDARDAVAETLARRARAVTRATGVAVEPWAVPATDLEEGRRTPMLIDALADGLPLWPAGTPPCRLPFTAADARFCARSLLDWVVAGGPIVRQALEQRCWDDAALRARDDITRLATAALLLQGDTRHRRRGSLRRFEERIVRPRLVSVRVLPALAWATAAFPPDGGRGIERPPATARAAATAPLGYRLATLMEREVVPYILDRMAGR